MSKSIVVGEIQRVRYPAGGACHRPSPGRRGLVPVLLGVLLVAGTCRLPAQPFGVYRELWTGLSTNNSSLSLLTNTTSNPNWPNNPNAAYTAVLAGFETATNTGLYGYGQRLRAFIVPPADGLYTFWIASDDTSILWFSTNESPASVKSVALVKVRTGPRQWNAETNQRSAPIRLQAGRRYYAEVVMRQAATNDNLAVRWQMPGGAFEEPLATGSAAGTLLVPCVSTNSPPGVFVGPTNTTVIEAQTATFSLLSTNQGPLAYQWQMNGTNLPGPSALQSVCLVSNITLGGYSGASFQCVLSNVAGMVTSAVVTLTVLPDITPPTLTLATNYSLTNVTIGYSEPVEPASATNRQYYTLDGGITVSGAALVDPRTVLLTVSTLTPNQAYTVTVNNVRDQAATPNTIAANSQIGFVASAFNPTDIGAPALAGSAAVVPGGYEVRGAGTNIGGVSDQFFFNYQTLVGDFDLKVRVESLTLSDLWAKAGLMARETLATNSRFAMVVATPSAGGVYLLARSTNKGTVFPAGQGPVTYPNTWLRLTRSGTNFTGYAGLDGQNWVQLGTVPMTNAAASFLVGMAVTGATSNQSATAEFRDLGSAAGGKVVPSLALGREPLGPSSRHTGLVISELMYRPRAVTWSTNGTTRRLDLEFIEIYNSQSFFENISGYALSGDVAFTFPQGTVMAAGSFLVLAKAPADVEDYYGLSNVLGYGVEVYTTNVVNGVPMITTNVVNSLSNTGGQLRLLNRQKAVLLEVNYSHTAPWPVAADGTGHSLALARPSYGENDPRAWAPSDTIDGSPGSAEPVTSEPARCVVINEFLANSDGTLEDYIELYNHSATAVDISGCWLSDSPATNKFRIPDSPVLPARGYVYFTEAQLGFALNAAGESIFLVNSNQSRVIDALTFEAQASGVSFGRVPDGAPTWREMAQRTPGGRNSGYLDHDVVINEIMFAPISGDSNDEYVELYNKGTNAVDLGNWRFVSGISFNFPPNTLLARNGYLVVAKNTARLLTNYSNLAAGNLVGNFGGTLAGGGERLALARPEPQVTTNTQGQLVTNILYIVVNEVTYGTSEKWGVWADGGGSSLELKDPHSDNRQAANWADSDETGKSQWTDFTLTGTIGETLGSPINDNLEVFLLGVGECLVDDVAVFNSATIDLLAGKGGFEGGLNGFLLQGSHDQSVIANEGRRGAQSLHIRAGSRGDNGANRVRSPALSPAAAGSVTLQASARWLRGWPELLLRVHGGGLEETCRLSVPANLGTPGARNSQAVANTGPVVFDVTHRPPLPAANQPVVVTARVQDPDGLSDIAVNYRLDPSATFTRIGMKDDGTGDDAVAGDGIYTATLPGRPAGSYAAFCIAAADNAASHATNIFPKDALNRAFPSDAPSHECVVRWGDVQMSGSFPTYHLWVTYATSNRWASREPLNNSVLDGTFVYNNTRVVYNMKPNYGGSPWHRGSMTTGPSGANRCDFAIIFPDDDKLLGETDFNWCNPGNPDGSNFSDLSMQTEQTSYLIFNEIGVVYNFRRYMHLFINGSQRSTSASRPGNLLFEDAQQPNGAMIRQWYPNDTAGELYKIEDWFEWVDDASSSFSNNDADLERRSTLIDGVNQINIANYRFMWRRRSIGPGDSASNYENFKAMLDAVSPATNAIISPIINTAQVEGLVNVEQWMRIFACQHTVGNWDSYGFSRGKNDFSYKPINGRFEQMTWDIDFTMGVGGNGTGDPVFQTTDPRVNAMWATPAFVRYYWRAFQDIVSGPLNNSFMDPILDAKAAAMAANNVNYDPSVVTTIKSYVRDRRTYLVSLLGSLNPKFRLSGSPVTNSTSGLVTFTGSAPISVQTITINGVAYPITWSGSQNAPTNWSIVAPVLLGSNQYVFQAYDTLGNLLTNASATNAVVFNGSTPDPRHTIVINEIMFAPAVADAEYVEIYNTSSNAVFDLSGWRLDGVGYTFPPEAFLRPKSFLLLAKSRFACAYAYGGTLPIFDEFGGNLKADGETLTLVQPGATADQDLVIDKVRYEGVLPWNTNAVGTGSSLQLIDLTQDHSRPGNWASGFVPAVWSDPVSVPATTNSGWRRVAITTNLTTVKAVTAPAVTNVVEGVTNITPAITNDVARLRICLDNTGNVYLDDVNLVLGTNAEQGLNYIHNGDFEAPLVDQPVLTNSFVIGTNLTASTVSTQFKHTGNSSLHLVQTGKATVTTAANTNQNLWQHIYPAPTNGARCTLSYWYLVTTSATNLSLIIEGGNLKTGTNVQPLVIPARYTPAKLLAAATNYLSPARTNPVATTLPAFPPLWLNELCPENPSGITDAQGHRSPWIELYNAGTNVESLQGLYLANVSTNPTQWAFPAGATVQPGQFKVIFADGAQNESSLAELHTSFVLSNRSGSVVLSRLYQGQPQALDYLNYQEVETGWSYGDLPNGQIFDRRVFPAPTPGAPNVAPPAAVRINEWMASSVNPGGYPDPLDGKYSDWFELYNTTGTAADLSGYYLTTVPADPTQWWQIPSGTILPPYGYRLVWADGDTGQNGQGSYGDLHVPFHLGRNGDTIALYTAGGTNLAPVDLITFGYQFDNVSEGRFPDGSTNRQFMSHYTPRAANVAGNTTPVLAPIPSLAARPGQAVDLTVSAIDPEVPPQTLTFALDTFPPGAVIDGQTGLLHWTTPDNPEASTNLFTVRVSDNGVPSLSSTYSFAVYVVNGPPPVITPPSASGILTVSYTVLPGGTYRVEYKDNLGQQAWQILQDGLVATSDRLTVQDNVAGLTQRFYRLVLESGPAR